MRPLYRKKTLLTITGLALLTLLSPLAVADKSKGSKEDCSFVDIFSLEERMCTEGPSDEAWEYLIEDKYGEFIISKDARAEMGLLWTDLFGETRDDGDPSYDSTSREYDQTRERAESWMNLLRLLIAIAGGAEEYLDDIGLNGSYDGTISNGSTSTEAYSELHHNGGTVTGSLLIRDSTLELDGGVCGSFEVPASMLFVNGWSAGGFDLVGDTRRTISVGPFTGAVEVEFDLDLETTDHRRLTGEILIDAPWPCSDQVLTVDMDRRMDEIF